jgi:hypothetical protein
VPERVAEEGRNVEKEKEWEELIRDWCSERYARLASSVQKEACARCRIELDAKSFVCAECARTVCTSCAIKVNAKSQGWSGMSTLSLSFVILPLADVFAEMRVMCKEECFALFKQKIATQ